MRNSMFSINQINQFLTYVSCASFLLGPIPIGYNPCGFLIKFSLFVCGSDSGKYIHALTYNVFKLFLHWTHLDLLYLFLKEEAYIHNLLSSFATKNIRYNPLICSWSRNNLPIPPFFENKGGVSISSPCERLTFWALSKPFP